LPAAGYPQFIQRLLGTVLAINNGPSVCRFHPHVFFLLPNQKGVVPKPPWLSTPAVGAMPARANTPLSPAERALLTGTQPIREL
jgi:hypothetical protein